MIDLKGNHKKLNEALISSLMSKVALRIKTDYTFMKRNDEYTFNQEYKALLN
jgi:hypothetical protein